MRLGGLHLRLSRANVRRMKTISCVFVGMLLVACGGKKSSTQSPGGAATMSGSATAGESKQITVTQVDWVQLDVGPATLTGATVSETFNGEFSCHAWTGEGCSNSETEGGAGRKLLECPGRKCVTVDGGTASAGEKICCGSTKGSGGDATVMWTK